MSYSNPYLLEDIARTCGVLPQDVERAAHLAAVSHGSAWMMADNPSLQPDVWRAAWDALAGGDVAAASGLACRPLSVPDVEHVIRTDRRGTVLAALSRANRISGRALELALAQASFRNPSAGAASLLLQESLPQDRVEELQERLTAKDLLRVLAFGPPGRLERSWAVSRLLSFDIPFAGRGRRNRLVQLACLRDPGLAPLMLQAACGSVSALELFGSPVCSTAAAGPHLDGFLAELAATRRGALGGESFLKLAIAGNPLASAEVLEKVAESSHSGSKPHTLAQSRLKEGARMPPGVDLCTDDRADQLMSALARSLPGGPYDAPGRPERLMLLARNPHLPKDGRDNLVDGVGVAFGSDAEVVIAEELDRLTPGWTREWLRTRPRMLSGTSAEMLRPLGPDPARWRVFFSLLDGWEGSISDLVATAQLM